MAIITPIDANLFRRRRQELAGRDAPQPTGDNRMTTAQALNLVPSAIQLADVLTTPIISGIAEYARKQSEKSAIEEARARQAENPAAIAAGQSAMDAARKERDAMRAEYEVTRNQAGGGSPNVYKLSPDNAATPLATSPAVAPAAVAPAAATPAAAPVADDATVDMSKNLPIFKLSNDTLKQFRDEIVKARDSGNTTLSRDLTHKYIQYFKEHLPKKDWPDWVEDDLGVSKYTSTVPDRGAFSGDNEPIVYSLSDNVVHYIGPRAFSGEPNPESADSLLKQAATKAASTPTPSAATSTVTTPVSTVAKPLTAPAKEEVRPEFAQLPRNQKPVVAMPIAQKTDESTPLTKVDIPLTMDEIRKNAMLASVSENPEDRRKVLEQLFAAGEHSYAPQSWSEIFNPSAAKERVQAEIMGLLRPQHGAMSDLEKLRMTAQIQNLISQLDERDQRKKFSAAMHPYKIFAADLSNKLKRGQINEQEAEAQIAQAKAKLADSTAKAEFDRIVAQTGLYKEQAGVAREQSTDVLPAQARLNRVRASLAKFHEDSYRILANAASRRNELSVNQLERVYRGELTNIEKKMAEVGGKVAGFKLRVDSMPNTQPSLADPAWKKWLSINGSWLTSSGVSNDLNGAQRIRQEYAQYQEELSKLEELKNKTIDDAHSSGITIRASGSAIGSANPFKP